MSSDSERLKILELIDSGVITPSQGIELLNALEDEPEEISAEDLSEPSVEPARLYAQAPVSQADQESESVLEYTPLPVEGQPTAEQADQSASEKAEVEDAPDEAPGSDAPPDLDPEIAKWRRWWWIPMTIGVSITVVSAALMYWAWFAGGFSFWFACAWFPFLLGVAGTLPELPSARRKRFVAQYELPDYDAAVLTGSRALADYFEEAVGLGAGPKQASNWIMTEMLRILGEQGEDADPRAFPVTPRHLAGLIRLIDDNTISGKIAKQVYPEMVATGKMPDVIVKEKGLVQITDEGALDSLVDEIIAENPKVVDEYRGGKEQSLKFLMGQAMKKSKGKANPQRVQEMLRKKIVGE